LDLYYYSEFNVNTPTTGQASQVLKAAFYESFDPSAIAAFLRGLSGKTESQRRDVEGFLGEGSHFQSFRMSTRPLELAVSVAKSTFTNRGELALKRWREALNLARKIEGETLVPPMEVIQSDGLTALVMPRGTDLTKASNAAANQRLHETSKALGSAGLVLDDYPQLRQAQGVPFIIDWSDLGFLRPALR
jgi:hypothetical protein